MAFDRNLSLGIALAGRLDNAWDVPDRPSAPCESIVRFAEKVAKMVNLPGTFEHRNIYAIETAPATAIEAPSTHGGLNTDGRMHPTQTTWGLALIDGDAGCNAFEATAKFTACGQTLFYAGGVPGAVFTNKDDVLKVFDTLSWIEFVGGVCTIRENVFQYPDAPATAPTPPCP